ncbi:hypothetical protein BDP27DRAFT_1330352 [Rhodocollybia butyracea]|uniref:Uncharacterized protein n=1 Tax=Rhodocollybia butyracea TaxID=206335 RepID=A0A9P5PME6_9AGAR|nr:hypothetical protein BDP27DRAFT_1330352 [Rhodocollybia butyracea]
MTRPLMSTTESPASWTTRAATNSSSSVSVPCCKGSHPSSTTCSFLSAICSSWTSEALATEFDLVSGGLGGESCPGILTSGLEVISITSDEMVEAMQETVDDNDRLYASCMQRDRRDLEPKRW